LLDLSLPTGEAEVIVQSGNLPMTDPYTAASAHGHEVFAAFEELRLACRMLAHHLEMQVPITQSMLIR